MSDHLQCALIAYVRTLQSSQTANYRCNSNRCPFLYAFRRGSAEVVYWWNTLLDSRSCSNFSLHTEGCEFPSSRSGQCVIWWSLTGSNR